MALRRTLAVLYPMARDTMFIKGFIKTHDLLITLTFSFKLSKLPQRIIHYNQKNWMKIILPFENKIGH